MWSAGAGVVADSSFTGVNDGHMVIVRHSPHGFFTVYTNLREPEVTAGQRIEQGQRLGFLGGSSLQPSDLLKLFVRIEDPQTGQRLRRSGYGAQAEPPPSTLISKFLMTSCRASKPGWHFSCSHGNTDSLGQLRCASKPFRSRGTSFWTTTAVTSGF